MRHDVTEIVDRHYVFIPPGQPGAGRWLVPLPEDPEACAERVGATILFYGTRKDMRVVRRYDR
jgi:hypothetical protein